MTLNPHPRAVSGQDRSLFKTRLCGTDASVICLEVKENRSNSERASLHIFENSCGAFGADWGDGDEAEARRVRGLVPVEDRVSALRVQR